MDESNLYDEYGNFLGALSDSEDEEEVIPIEIDSRPQTSNRAYDQDEEELETLEGMEVDGTNFWK